MSTKILCVDDDEVVLATYQRNLRKQFSIDTALGGLSGLAKLETEGPFAVVVSDMQMPAMNGIEFLKQVEAKSPDTVRIMLTGNADQKTAMEAVNQGHVFRFLAKPCPPNALALALEAGLSQYRLITAEKELLEKTITGAIKVLTEILSVVEPHSFGRGQKLRGYMSTFAKSLQMQQDWELEAAALLSQIGYVTIPAVVTERARAGHGLSGAEKDMLRRVPEIGRNLLANIPRLESLAQIVLYQDKHYDGAGFPSDAVSGEAIPLGARILKVLSDLLELESTGAPKFKALEEMQKRVGWYDTRVLDAAFAHFDVYREKADSAAVPTRAVVLKDLPSGAVLAADVRTRDGMLIVTMGSKVSPMLLERLRNFQALAGVKEPIYVEDR